MRLDSVIDLVDGRCGNLRPPGWRTHESGLVSGGWPASPHDRRWRGRGGDIGRTLGDE